MNPTLVKLYLPQPRQRLQGQGEEPSRHQGRVVLRRPDTGGTLTTLREWGNSKASQAKPSQAKQEAITYNLTLQYSVRRAGKVACRG